MAKKKPDVWTNAQGAQRLVWSQDDEIKAQFDGFKPANSSTPSPAPKPKND